MAQDDALMALIGAIVADDRARARQLLDASPALTRASLETGASRQEARDFWIAEIGHYVYRGDTALHVAAAAHRVPIVDELLQRGADVDARNRRGATALHYSTDAGPGSRTWNPHAIRDTITRLLEAGADPNAVDKSGTAPLHRAIRNRCTPAVEALLDGGADAQAANGSGSTPLQLATWTTGKSGSGSTAAKAEQEKIQLLLRAT